MGKLFNIKAAYPLLKTMYDIELDADDFEDLALNAWELIGNKHTRLYRYVGSVVNGEMKLPCNVDQIESVHIPIVDFQATSNIYDHYDIQSAYVEQYIDAWKLNQSPFNERGMLVNYKEGDNILYFSNNWPKVTVIYQGILVDDEDGLPLINDREMRAIAAYIAWIHTFKDAIKKRDKNSFTIAQMLQTEWLKRCNAARIVDHLSQNDMNTILDAKYRWDRKQYGKSMLPLV